jgi:hypothetical protein
LETCRFEKLDAVGIQIWLNQLAAKDYSEAVVSHCFTNIRAITRLAKKQKYLSEDPGEDVSKPQTKSVERPVMTREQILSLLGAINDVHDLCLLCVGIFCGPRASEVMGMQWKSWNGESLMPHGTAYEGKLYVGRFKTKQSKAPIPVPELVRPVIENWRRLCADSSPDALMFPTFGRGKRKGQAVPRRGKNFLTWSVRPIARTRRVGHMICWISPRPAGNAPGSNFDRLSGHWMFCGLTAIVRFYHVAQSLFDLALDVDHCIKAYSYTRYAVRSKQLHMSEIGRDCREGAIPIQEFRKLKMGLDPKPLFSR